MTDVTQAHASLRLSTALGDDALILLTLEGEERLSAPFEFRLTAEAASDGADLGSLLGEDATVTLTGGEDVSRVIKGRVWSVRREGRACALTLRPWLSLLSLRSDNRIFQEQTTTEIVSAVFDDAGFSDYRVSLTGTLTARPYCVQFGETDLAFVSRLLEEEGLGYFFEHAASACTLVIFDDVSACAALSGGAVPFLPLPRQGEQMGERRVQSLAARGAVVSGKVDARDFNFETPSQTLQVSMGDGARGPYVYPGRYDDTDGGQTVARRRLEALEAEAAIVEGASPLRLMIAGATFALSGHPETDLNGDYLIRAVSHRAARGDYANRFEAQAKDTPFRPLPTTPRPRMAGPQTAKVVGKAGEEIWTDAHGRIKVQFHWDRLGAGDENSSCWVRVAQVWAGAGWGAFTLPRIGQEVVVAFLDGDPDRPLVTGVVYNGENATPYTLPANQTKTTLKSDSSKGAEGFNELRFEDKAGSEEIYIHAQKDMKREILNDRTTDIGHDDTTTIKNNRTVTISEGAESLTVEKGSRTITVTQGDETHEVGGKRSLTVTGNETRDYGAKLTETVAGDAAMTVKGKLTITVTGDVTIKSSGALNLEAGGSMSLKSGSGITLSAGTSASVKAGTSLDLSGGTSTTVKGSASATLDGGGMLTVKGGIVKIN